MAGFESLCEPFEVKLRDDTGGMAKLIVTKGVGRASIILFGILYTYLEFAADLTAEEMKDFRRQKSETTWLEFPFDDEKPTFVHLLKQNPESEFGFVPIYLVGAH